MMQEAYGKFLYLALNFVINLKLSYKNKVFKKIKSLKNKVEGIQSTAMRSVLTLKP